MYLVGFPLLLIPFAIYNIVAFLMPGVSWTDAMTRVALPSGGEWAMSLGDMLVAFAILLLLIEIIKAYRLGGRNLVDHGLSILLLIAMGAEFYLVQRAATAAFFLLMVASFADVTGGLIAMRRRRAPAVYEPEPAQPIEPEQMPEPVRVSPVVPVVVGATAAATMMAEHPPAPPPEPVVEAPPVAVRGEHDLDKPEAGKS